MQQQTGLLHGCCAAARQSPDIAASNAGGSAPHANYYLHDHGGVSHDAAAWSELLDGGRGVEGPGAPAEGEGTRHITADL